MDVNTATGLVEVLQWVSLLSEDPHLGRTGWVRARLRPFWRGERLLFQTVLHLPLIQIPFRMCGKDEVYRCRSQIYRKHQT